MANLCEFVPPSFALPFAPSKGTDVIALVSVKDGRPIKIKYVKKGIVVKDVDPRNMWAVAREPGVFTIR